MTNHPNRKGRTGIPPSSPTPEQVRELRAASGLTQTEAAALVYVTFRTWQRWEGAEIVIPAATWELFLLKLTWRGVKIPEKFQDHISVIQRW